MVVEPLRALIDSQVQQLRGKGVNVNQLLTVDEAKQNRKLSSRDYLQTLINKGHCDDGPLIIFSTPELINHCVNQIGCLSEKKMLSLVVIDEFDYISDCNVNHRKAYTTIVPTLKEKLGQNEIPFFFLSATGCFEKCRM